MAKVFLLLGAVNALLAVILGAFGAHGLRDRLSESMLAVYHTGMLYHFFHALGLMGVGLLALHMPASLLLKTAGWTMLAGILLFSGSLYVLAVTGVRWLGMVTPVGGVAFIISWGLLAVAAYNSQ
jgi:uncharacterized membrane protein YgdD (TMEM256/DUF423 family)